MTRRLRPAIPCLLFLGAGAVFAAEGGAPLEQTKQELQKLRSEQKAGEPAAAEGLKSGLPGIAAPTDPGLPFQMMSPEALREQDRRKKEAAKNWLVDGMAKLERESQRKGRLPGDKEEKTEDDLADDGGLNTSDPAFLLKTYERNKARQDMAAEKKSAGNQPGTKRADPLAPFMQEWLANSPVRDQVLQGLGRKSEVGADATRDPVFDFGVPAEPKNGTPQPAGSGLAPVAAAKANPYLVDLGPAPQTQATPGTAEQNAASSPLALQPGQGPAAPMLQPLPELVPASKKPLPPALSEEKKYFPQLKKF